MKTIILGGGISGLSAAWYLHKKEPNREILLLEKGGRLGGWIESQRFNEPYFFEKGPRTLSKDRSKNLLRLIDELGLSSEMVLSNPKAARRFLWYRKRLRSVGSFWPLIAFSSIREYFRPAQGLDDETIDSFAKRRFGSKMAHLFFDPITLGVYAGDSKKLSIRSSFSSLWNLERGGKSIVKSLLQSPRGSGSLFTLKGGLEKIVTEIGRQVPMRVHLNCPVEEIRSNGVKTPLGFFEADQILSALPAYEISRLISIPFHLPYRSLWVVQLGFKGKLLPSQGFGYLVPSIEREKLLGMVWDSEIFDVEPNTRITAMIRSEVKSVDEALDIAYRGVHDHLKIGEKPQFCSSFYAKNAIPQFEVGHHERLAQFEKEALSRYPHLLLTGNYFSGASLEAAVERSYAIYQKS